MAEYREVIPTITGPGAFLVSLIFLALILTSDKSRAFAFNWEYDVALVAISLPISVLITQLYHAFFVKFGYRMKNWGEKYTKYKKNKHKLDVMVDYLAHKNCRGDKEWVIIQKRDIAYNLFSMLRWISIIFILCYTIFLIWNDLYGDIQVFGWGISLMYGIAFLCAIIFWLACNDIWDVYMILDNKIIKDVEGDLDIWIQEANIKEE